jgi:hypothetical protein
LIQWPICANLVVSSYVIGSIGLPKPWYFPVMKSYWCGGRGHLEDPGKRCMFDWWTRLFPYSTNLSVMEEDQACAMDDSSTGE